MLDPTNTEGVKISLLPANGRTTEEQRALAAHEAPVQQLPVRLTALPGEDIFLLDDLLKACSDDLIGLRNKMLVSVVFDTGLRGSELVSLYIDQIELIAGAGQVRVNKIKGNKQTMRSLSAVSCGLIKQWLIETRQTLDERALLFRSMTKTSSLRKSGLPRRQVTRIVKTLAKTAGYDNLQIDYLSSHSFRIGHAQELFIRGFSEFQIMQSLDWTNSATLHEYLRSLKVRQNATSQMLVDRKTVSNA